MIDWCRLEWVVVIAAEALVGIVDSLYADVRSSSAFRGAVSLVFTARGNIEVPAHVDPASVYEKLAVWAVEKGAKMTFEEVADDE